jgi:hypothetical protein
LGEIESWGESFWKPLIRTKIYYFQRVKNLARCLRCTLPERLIPVATRDGPQVEEAVWLGINNKGLASVAVESEGVAGKAERLAVH